MSIEIQMGLGGATELRSESKSGPKDSNVIIIYHMLLENRSVTINSVM